LPQEGDIILVQGNTVAVRHLVLKSDVLEVWSAIWAASNKYGTDFDTMWDLAKCESSLNPVAKGDAGLAYGIFQWHKPSWDMYNKRFGIQLDRNNAKDQAEMTAKVLLLSGGYRNWTNCFNTKVLADTL
jgi:hypothetical protein